MFPVFGGGHSYQLFKGFPEVIAVAVTYPGGNIGDLVSGIDQQVFSLVDPEIGQILIQRLACFAFEKRTDIGGGEKNMLTDIFDGERLVLIMAGYKFLDQIDCGMVFAAVLKPGKKSSFFFFSRSCSS